MLCETCQLFIRLAIWTIRVPFAAHSDMIPNREDLSSAQLDLNT